MASGGDAMLKTIWHSSCLITILQNCIALTFRQIVTYHRNNFFIIRAKLRTISPLSRT
jgi:hypothetical protein